MSAPSRRPSKKVSLPVPSDERVMSALYRISGVVTRIDDPGTAIAEIVNEIAAIFEAGSVVLALIDPDTSTLVIEHSRGFPPEHAQAPIPAGIGLMGWVAVQRRPLVIGDVAFEPRYLALRPGTRASMVIPLEIDGHLHGVIDVEHDTPHAYTNGHLAILERIVAEAAGALRRLWHIAHLRRKASQLEVLSNIGQELTSKLQPEELMETVTRESHRLTQCRLATLQLFDPRTRRTRLQAIFPPEDCFGSGEKEWDLEDCLAGSAINTRRQIEFSNIHQAEYADLRDIPERAHVVSVLATPLLAEKEVVGVLNVFTDRPHRFSNDERQLMRTLANLASVALQNARLYQRVFASEEGMRQSERLTTLGMLAAEIAHETRNPLTVIRLLFGALNLEFPPDDPRSTDVGVIREKLDQLESFVTRVLTLAKAPDSLHARWPIDSLIRETCQLLRLKLNQARIHLHYDPPDRPLVVECNKGQIQQVLLNVILNATQAMPDGGSIAIRCYRATNGGPAPAVVEIADTGRGIPAEFRERVFDSFLSGRPDGTGLGLAIAKRIMRSHHGDIEIASTGPEGTTMRISLPVLG